MKATLPDVSRACYSVRLVRPFIAALADVPGCVQEVLSQLKDLDPDQRIYVRYAHGLVESAAKVTGDKFFGIKASHCMTSGDAGLFDFLMSSARTPRAAYEAGKQYIRLISDSLDLALVVEQETAVARLESWIPLPHQVEDFAVISLVRNQVFTWPEGMRNHMTAWFRHEAPSDEAPYRKALGPVRLHFRADFSGSSFPSRYLDDPIQKRDQRLHDFLRTVAESKLATFSAAETMTERVSKLLVRELDKGKVTLPGVAKLLDMHPRKLGRALTDEGTRFQDVLESVRRSTACDLLAGTDLPLARVAQQTGFECAASFHRAFQRWTGGTPMKYRKSRRGGVVPAAIRAP